MTNWLSPKNLMFIGIFAVAGIFVAGVLGFIPLAGIAGRGVVGEQPVEAVGGYFGQIPSLTLTSYRYGQTGTVIGSTISADVYKADGTVFASGKAANTAFNVEQGASYIVFDVSNTTQFATKGDIQITPGQNSLRLLYPEVQNGSVTVLNPPSWIATNVNGTEAAFAANDQKVFKIQVSGSSYTFVTNPRNEKIRLSLSFNTPANWLYGNDGDTFMETNGQRCIRVSAPTESIRTQGDQLAGVTGPAQVTFECPAPRGITGSVPQDFYLTLKAGTSDPADEADRIGLSIRPVDEYVDTNLGTLDNWGVEKNDGTNLHTSMNRTIHIS